jgi:hypothetical protein
MAGFNGATLRRVWKEIDCYFNTNSPAACHTSMGPRSEEQGKSFLKMLAVHPFILAITIAIPSCGLTDNNKWT